MGKSPAYWAKRRSKAGGNFVKNGLRTAMDPSVGNLARLAWSGVKGLRALVNAEKHFTDYSGAGLIAYSTGQVIDLTAISQGDTINNRTGNSVLVNNVSNRLFYTKDVNATNTLIKVMLVLDTQQIADTAVTASSILESVDPLSPLNRQNLGRYKILATRNVSLHSSKTMAKVNIFRKFKKHHYRYNGTASTDIQKGGLYLVSVHNEPTNLPSIGFNSTVAYYDN